MNQFDSNPYHRGPREGDDKLYVKFYMGTRINDGKSREAGHPVYDDVPMVVIRVPGDKNTVIDTAVEDEHKYRFPNHWEKFSKGLEQVQSGWSIRDWPAITRGQAEELNGIGIHTVEQLASVADGLASRIMGGYELKRKAATALEQAKDGALSEKLAAENADLRTSLKAQQEQIDVLSRRMEAMLNGKEQNVANSPASDSGRRK